MKRHAIAFTGMMVFFAMFSLALTVVFNGNGTLQVDEVITLDAFDVNVQIQPNVTINKQTVAHNSGPEDVTIVVAADVVGDNPPGPYPGVTVTDSGNVVVPANGSVIVGFQISANNGVPPGTGNIAVTIHRP